MTAITVAAATAMARPAAVAERIAVAPHSWEVASSQPGHTKTLDWDSLPVSGLRHIRTWSED
jgi:hypothetical protein